MQPITVLNGVSCSLFVEGRWRFEVEVSYAMVEADWWVFPTTNTKSHGGSRAFLRLFFQDHYLAR